MFNVSTENFLNEYFLFGSILGELNNEKVFRVLADICGIDKKQVKALYALTESQNVKEINTYNEYTRYLRMNQYLEAGGLLEKDDEYTLITIKGQALSYTSKFNLAFKEGMTAISIQKELMRNAGYGKVVAMRCLGILQCEGLIVAKNMTSGINTIKKVARWGDITAALALFKYAEEERETAYSLLNAAVENTPFEYLRAEVKDRYNITSDEKSASVLLIKEAFDQQIVEVDNYNAFYDRVLQSKVLSLADKRKLIILENKNVVAAASDLPLALEFRELDYTGIATIFEREEERAKIDVVLRNNDLRDKATYKPLCLVSDDEYVSAAYVRAIKSSFPKQHCEVIYVRELADIDADNTNESAIIRAIDENQNNVIILVARGEIPASINAKIIEFVQNAIRRKYRLRTPPTAINLSAVYPVCVVDRENAEAYAQVTDQIKLGDLKRSELPLAIQDVFQSKCNKSLVENGKMEEGVLNKLTALGMDSAKQILEAAIKELRAKDLVLTMDNMQKFFAEQNGAKKGYGFGGRINENK